MKALTQPHTLSHTHTRSTQGHIYEVIVPDLHALDIPPTTASVKKAAAQKQQGPTLAEIEVGTAEARPSAVPKVRVRVLCVRKDHSASAFPSLF